MDIQPEPSLLESMRRQNLPWRDLLGELIDNSLDAQCDRVEITLGPKRRVKVVDDGIGCDDIAKMLTLGKHYRRPGTKLGRYGVGLKDVGCSLWGTTIIKTVASGRQQECRIRWPHLAKCSSWTIEDPVTTTPTIGQGTVIEFHNVDRRLPQSVDQLSADLGFMFAPALRSGKQILLRGKGKRGMPCKPYTLPVLTDVVEDVFEVSGRGVRLRAGVVKDGERNDRPGFTFFHEHRVIENSALGAIGYSVERVAGEVELDHRWTLSKNKNRIVESREELAQAIHDRCKALFEKARMQTRDLRLEGISRHLGKLLSNLVAKRREKRKSPVQSGSKRAKPDGGSKRRRASRTQPGDHLLEEMSAGVTIGWIYKADGSLGVAQLSPARIDLNLSNPFIGAIRDGENHLAIGQAALQLLAHEYYDQEQADVIPAFRDYTAVQEALSALLPKLVEDMGGESSRVTEAS